MGLNTSSGRKQWVDHLPVYIGLAAAATGCVVLLGWIADIPILTSLLPGLATMKPNTAAAFVIISACLWLLRMKAGEMPSTIRLRAAQALAFVLAAISVLTLVEYAADVDLGIDHMLVGILMPQVQAAASWRMAPMTAVNFTLLAAAFLTLDVVTARGRRPAHWIALGVAANSFVALLGYVYGVSPCIGSAPSIRWRCTRPC